MADFKGTREAFAQALLDMAEDNNKIMFVSPDSLKAMRATKFADLHPDQYVEVGIAEQCAVDAASGLAACGLTPFVGTYAGFMTMRACEQMRTFVAYPNLNVKFVGINAGLLGGEREGVTHQFYEDIGILATMPGFTILTPADGPQTYHAVKMAASIPGPVYVRAGSGRETDVYAKDAPFSPDGITVWKNYGADALLLSSGFVLDRVLAAAELLKEQGIQVSQIVTVEDHSVNGGLGSYISKLACENEPKKVKRIGLTTFGESGPAKELADHYGFSPEAIAKTTADCLK